MTPPKIQRRECASEIMRRLCPYTRRPPYLCLVDLEGEKRECPQSRGHWGHRMIGEDGGRQRLMEQARELLLE